MLPVHSKACLLCKLAMRATYTLLLNACELQNKLMPENSCLFQLDSRVYVFNVRLELAYDHCILGRHSKPSRANVQSYLHSLKAIATYMWRIYVRYSSALFADCAFRRHLLSALWRFSARLMAVVEYAAFTSLQCWGKLVNHLRRLAEVMGTYQYSARMKTHVPRLPLSTNVSYLHSMKSNSHRWTIDRESLRVITLS